MKNLLIVLANHWQLLWIVGVTCVSVAHAGIDSGGGIASLGEGSNHSSVGGSFATGDSATGLIDILYPGAPALDPAADSDGNGLPDAWEIEYFGANGLDPLADADGDGTSNLMEYLAGTNPRNSTSVFRPTSQIAGGDLVLSVPTAEGRAYRIWGVADLNGPWTAHDTIEGDGSTIEWRYAVNQSPRYFLRIEILIAPN